MLAGPVVIALIAMKLMETGLGPRVAKLASWAIVALLALLALWFAYSFAYDNGRDDERDKWEAAAAKIEAADAKADAAGTVTAAETKGKVDATNKAAEDAARNSDDGLAAAFDELRRQAAGEGDKAAR